MSRVQDHSDRERPIASDALTDKERAVLQLTDAGLDRSAIADRTGLKLHRVASLLHNYAYHRRHPCQACPRIRSIQLGCASFWASVSPSVSLSLLLFSFYYHSFFFLFFFPFSIFF